MRESQLDQFIVGVLLGCLDPIAEKILRKRLDKRVLLRTLEKQSTYWDYPNCRHTAKRLGPRKGRRNMFKESSPKLREVLGLTHELSLREAMALLASAKSWAFI